MNKGGRPGGPGTCLVLRPPCAVHPVLWFMEPGRTIGQRQDHWGKTARPSWTRGKTLNRGGRQPWLPRSAPPPSGRVLHPVPVPSPQAGRVRLRRTLTAMPPCRQPGNVRFCDQGLGWTRRRNARGAAHRIVRRFRDESAGALRSSLGADRPAQLTHLHGLQDSAHAGHFVGAEEVGFAESGQDGEERLGATDFLAEIVEGMGQGVADGAAEGAQAESV